MIKKATVSIKLAFSIIFCSMIFQSCILKYNNDTEWTFPEIYGYVVDSISNEPIRGAKIYEKYYGDTTLFTDTNGFFRFKAESEFIKWQFIAMDPPKPYIDLTIEYPDYIYKDISIKYKKILYSREKPDTINLDTIRINKN